MKQARALLAEAQCLHALVTDDERLRNEFPRQSGIIANTFRDYEDEFRKRWHSLKPARTERRTDVAGMMPRAYSVDYGSRERLLCARYLSIAQDLRNATRTLNGAVRYENAGSIEVKRAEIRDAVRKLSGLIRDGVAGQSDEQMRAVESLI
ncbi:hypothetical protein T458_06935 [Brevibacillus panacihumi W25]|uniref:Uncharacterized protein n=1 Tax=Brevibacillus panacihumi W25 TaxID=1408254 RepID=V6MBT2_9BACL|nr:hypothetical protein [Brevibacillus panacihumi]EST55687.1 hypothetical protein T458_06935 [Brevibacillus panacihumi W25]